MFLCRYLFVDLICSETVTTDCTCVQSTNLMIKKDFQEEKGENKCLPRKRIVSRDDLISLVPIKKGQQRKTQK